MKWTVVWLPNCEQELAAIWLSTADRRAILQAAAIVDR